MKRKKIGINAYDVQIENYARSSSNEIVGFSDHLIDVAERENIYIEDDVKTLDHEIKNDIRKTIPPQIYSLISGMIEAIETLEASDEG